MKIIKRENFTQVLLIVILVIFAHLYYTLPTFLPDIDKIYITITTFFFSIFTGFFVSQQMARYAKIRETISQFDGHMSSMYRSSENVNKEVQHHVGEIIRNHYEAMIKSEEWDYHLTHKSNTITSIHTLLEEKVGNASIETLRGHALGKIVDGLSECEIYRKKMVMLCQERIPAFQWFIITFFTCILILAVSAIPSQGLALQSILKAAFGVSILSIASILHHLDNLHLFEHFIGEHSAKDVIDLIDGKK